MTCFHSRADDILVLPGGYRLDDSDPDVHALIGPAGEEIAWFSPAGAARRTIEVVAWRDADRQTPEQNRPNSERRSMPESETTLVENCGHNRFKFEHIVGEGYRGSCPDCRIDTIVYFKTASACMREFERAVRETIEDQRGERREAMS